MITQEVLWATTRNTGSRYSSHGEIHIVYSQQMCVFSMEVHVLFTRKYLLFTHFLFLFFFFMLCGFSSSVFIPSRCTTVHLFFVHWEKVKVYYITQSLFPRALQSVQHMSPSNFKPLIRLKDTYLIQHILSRVFQSVVHECGEAAGLNPERTNNNSTAGCMSAAGVMKYDIQQNL